GRGGQASGNVRQRDGDNRGVEHFHEGRQHHRGGNQPGIAFRKPFGSSQSRFWLDDFCHQRLSSLAVCFCFGSAKIFTLGTTDMPGPNGKAGSVVSSKT